MTHHFESMDPTELHGFVTRYIAGVSCSEMPSDYKGYRALVQRREETLPSAMARLIVARASFVGHSYWRESKVFTFFLGPPPSEADAILIVDLQSPENSIGINIHPADKVYPVRVITQDFTERPAYTQSRAPTEMDLAMLNRVVGATDS